MPCPACLVQNDARTCHGWTVERSTPTPASSQPVQITCALCAALDSGGPVQRDAALMLARDLTAAAQPSLFLPCLPALLPLLLDCAAEQGSREVAVAADEALEQLLVRLPPQSCLGLLAPRLPAPGCQLGTDRQAGAQLHATVRSLQRVACRMQPAGLAAHLQPLLLPGLCAAYCSPLADVRKATVDCLVTIWLVRHGKPAWHPARRNGWCAAGKAYGAGQPARNVRYILLALCRRGFSLPPLFRPGGRRCAQAPPRTVVRLPDEAAGHLSGQSTWGRPAGPRAALAPHLSMLHLPIALSQRVCALPA